MFLVNAFKSDGRIGYLHRAMIDNIIIKNNLVTNLKRLAVFNLAVNNRFLAG